MTTARSSQIFLSETPYYHCVSHCVRSALLSGDGFDHRRVWIQDKLMELSKVFCIDVAAYAVMRDHFHVVLHVDVKAANALADIDVVKCWHHLFKGNLLSQQLVNGEQLSGKQKRELAKDITLWRNRLMDIGWFMRIINESIARKANAEDKCRGRFWQSRYRSQTLLDDKALAAYMAYVDLNPVRSKMAKRLKKSCQSSIIHRLADGKSKPKKSSKKLSKKAAKKLAKKKSLQKAVGLMPFACYPQKNMQKGLPFKLEDYIHLLTVSAEIICANKKARLSDDHPLLAHLGIKANNWIIMTKQFEKRFSSWVGSSESIQKSRQRLNLRHVTNSLQCKLLFD